MSFPKVAASCADTAVIVWYATFLLAAIIPSAGKEIHHPSSGNGFNQVWQQVAQGGRGWHWLEAAVILLILKIGRWQGQK